MKDRFTRLSNVRLSGRVIHRCRDDYAKGRENTSLGPMVAALVAAAVLGFVLALVFAPYELVLSIPLIGG